MRKKYGHEGRVKQLSLFKSQTVSLRPESRQDSGTVVGKERESKYYSLLARNRAFTETLLEEVMSATNLNRAYERVRSNKGSSGVDGMDIEELKLLLREKGETIINQVLNEEYKPEQVLGVEIEKSSGGVRLLGIPTVLDRMIQQAIHQQLTKYYEPLFSDQSYGFRPNRSAHQAIEKSSEYVSVSYTHLTLPTKA